MKKLLFLFLFSAGIQAFGQKGEWPKKFPPGVVLLGDYDMAMDNMEVTLGEWFGYLYFLHEEGENWDILKRMLPAVYPEKYGNLLLKFEKAMEAPDDSYYIASHPSGLSFPWPEKPTPDITGKLMFPVVGIGYEDIQDYIIWREEMVNEHKALKKFDGWLAVRLIDVETWHQLSKEAGVKSQESIEMGNLFPDSVNTTGCYLMNIRYQEICESIREMEDNWGSGPVPVSMFFPDNFGLFNLFGNVAEMTNEEGIAIGGSYQHWGKEGFSGSVQPYKEPEKWLGFRCIYLLE